MCDSCGDREAITCAIYCPYSKRTKNICKQCKTQYPLDYCHCCMQKPVVEVKKVVVE